MITDTEAPPRLLTPDEVGLLVRTFRDFRQWSQATLAEIAGLTERTVQRVEAGEPSSVDTRRALAVALQYEDPDAFNKPHAIPTEEETRKAKEAFEREHLILDAVEVTSGRQLAGLYEWTMMDMSYPAEEMPEPVQQEFAILLDYLRDYRDAADEYSEVQKLDVHADLQKHLDAITSAGFVVLAARRDTQLVARDCADAKPVTARLLYLTTAPKDQSPRKLAVPRTVRL